MRLANLALTFAAVGFALWIAKAAPGTDGLSYRSAGAPAALSR